eukprot:TRINITY_DN2420_c0_g1_i1.p1 TRINITY_DN2420_c0_g1~~TRINITY_DN2420_c0_g1_i1.p1  ORF type:complete len:501 (+),score=81.63 TRINITY_DN2420_c0_g1_i1:218-1504(+)
MSEDLYQKLQTEFESHIKSKLSELLERKTADNQTFLILVNKLWHDHCENVLLIRSIFLYLDRKYALQNANVKSIWDMGLELFRVHIASHEEVKTKTITGLLELIERERRGETVDRSLLKNLLRMFGSLGMYTEVFEKKFLEATETFYSQESVEKIRDSKLPEFLLYIEKRIEQENDRVLHYLDSISRKPLISVLERVVLFNNVATLIDKGFDELIDENRVGDLARMYNLYNRVNSLKNLKDAWNEYIKKKGKELIMDEEKDKVMVTELLKFKSKLDILLKEAFQRNDDFTYALREAFEHFINLRQNAPAELIAKFLHLKLRSGKNKGSSDEQIEILLDQVMTIFRFINGKDVFEAFYKKDLAKRLLLGKSSSVDAEKAMISKLKTECGANFTNKLEGMFKDIDLSRDMMEAFSEVFFFPFFFYLIFVT